MASATCHGDCQAQAQAKLDCAPPQVQFDIVGDAALYASFQTHLTDIGNAVSHTLALKDLIIGSNGIASQTEATFSAIGEVGAGGLACIASQATAVINVQASIKVSVSATATVSGQSS